MRLILFHPQILSFSCEDCKKYIYDLRTGDLQTYKSGPKREDKPMLRPKDVATPCDKCPRESPELAPTYELSSRNHRTLLLYQKAKATGFHYLTDEEKHDSLVARNFSILDSLYEEKRRHRDTASLVENLLPLLVR